MHNFLSNKNTKLARSGIFSFGIPAGEYCPGKAACALGCYAMQGFFVMPSVRLGQKRRAELTKSDSFAAVMDAEIKRRKVRILRIHDSGDFYSLAYLNKWLEVIQKNPKTKFYAYTKMIPLFLGRPLPKNFTVIFSYGGKWDEQIDPSIHAHSRVFSSLEELKAAGYVDTTRDDTNAMKSRKVGLVYHGAKTKQWTTENDHAKQRRNLEHHQLDPARKGNLRIRRDHGENHDQRRRTPARAVIA